MRALMRRQRQTASLIRSAVPEFDAPVLPDGFEAALADAPDTANLPQPRPARRARVALAIGVAALVVLGTLLLLRPEDAAGELRRAGSALLSAKWIHEVARQYERDTAGNWVNKSGFETWQFEQRQWQILRLPSGAPISYRYYEGPGRTLRAYSVRTGKLQEFPHGLPLQFFWDWGQLEGGRPRWLAGDAKFKVDRLPNQRWRGKDVKVLRLNASEPAQDEVSVFYVDVATGLPVRRDAILHIHRPDEETMRITVEWDYTPFDPSNLFDPAEMAKRAGATRGGVGTAPSAPR